MINKPACLLEMHLNNSQESAIGSLVWLMNPTRGHSLPQTGLLHRRLAFVLPHKNGFVGAFCKLLFAAAPPIPYRLFVCGDLITQPGCRLQYTHWLHLMPQWGTAGHSTQMHLTSHDDHEHEGLCANQSFVPSGSLFHVYVISSEMLFLIRLIMHVTYRA